jgi:hypothetical protein
MDVKVLCDKCKKNEVKIYNDCGNCCLYCWYDMTDPSVSSELGFFSEGNDDKQVIPCTSAHNHLQ